MGQNHSVNTVMPDPVTMPFKAISWKQFTASFDFAQPARYCALSGVEGYNIGAVQSFLEEHLWLISR
jgi:hypothetical protein